MSTALINVREHWQIAHFPNDKDGMRRGLNRIRHSLNQGNPVMIEVHLGPGHTFVVMGYNDERRVVYIRDPNISKYEARILSYHELERYWNNHKFSNSRSAFLSQQ